MNTSINLSVLSTRNSNFKSYKNLSKKQNVANNSSSNSINFTSSNLDVLGRASLLIGKNFPSFNGNMPLTKQEKYSFKKELQNLTYVPYLSDKPHRRFLDSDAKMLSNLANQDNIEQIRELLDMEVVSGQPKFSFCQIVSLVDSMNEDNFPFIRRMANENNRFGVPRFEDYLISSIASTINKQNISFVNPLLDLKTPSGEYRLSGHDVKDLLPIVNEDNYEYVCDLLKLEDSIGRSRFSGDNVARIVSTTTPQNRPYIDRLLAYKTSSGEPLFNSTSIQLIAQNVNEDNFKFVDKILDIKNEYSHPIYENDPNSVAHLFTVANDDNFDRIERLVQTNYVCDNKYSGFRLSLLAKRSTEDNFDVILNLFK